MKSTDNFKKTIKTHLDELAKIDKLFAVSYANDKKTLSECIQFIIATVQKSGQTAFTDDEVYGMAIHYYDEKDLEITGGVMCKVICPGELTSTDKASAKAAALKEYQEELKEALMQDAQNKRAKRSKKEAIQQPSLF